MDISSSVINQFFSFKNGLELVTAFMALAQGFFIWRISNRKLGKLHATFLILLGIHFLLLVGLNIFLIELPFVFNFLLYFYGPLLYIQVKSCSTNYNINRDVALFAGLALIITLFYHFYPVNGTVIAAIVDHNFINIFLIIGIIKISSVENLAPANVKSWLKRFMILFLVINTLYIAAAVTLAIESALYIWLKTPVALLFTVLLIYNFGAVFLDNKLLNYLKSSGKNEYQKVNGLKESIEEIVLAKELYLNPDLELQDLAQELNQSLKTISSVLNNEMNTSFYSYINNMRVGKAAEIIKERPDVLIKEVMYDSGFSNKVTLNKAFKERFGCTPSEYKKSINR